MKSEPTQEAQETVAKNESASPSDANLMHELMKYKTQRNELREKISSYEANEEKRRTKKLEDEGKYKEVIAELKSTNEKQAMKIERAEKLETQLKVDIINSITSDESKKEELAGKDLETLRFIQNEIGTKTINNPQESIGSVRNNNKIAGKDWTDLSDEDLRNNWGDIVENARRK